jgi:hypothetical protein
MGKRAHDNVQETSGIPEVGIPECHCHIPKETLNFRHVAPDYSQNISADFLEREFQRIFNSGSEDNG